MLYVLYGSDWQRIGERTEQIKEKIGSHLFSKKDADSFREVELKEWVALSSGLFGERIVVCFDRVFDNEEAEKCILSHTQELISSENIFILREEKLLAKTKKALERASLEEYKSEEKKTESLSLFSLTDALLSRDKKRAWALFIEFSKKTPGEEIHGVLWWQVKTLLSVQNSPKLSAEALGMKPFTLSKAKTALTKYTKEEVENFADDLVYAYHNAHRGIGNLLELLEQIILRRI